MSFCVFAVRSLLDFKSTFSVYAHLANVMSLYQAVVPCKATCTSPEGAIPAHVIHFSNAALSARQTTAYQMHTMQPMGCASLMLSY